MLVRKTRTKFSFHWIIFITCFGLHRRPWSEETVNPRSSSWHSKWQSLRQRPKIHLISRPTPRLLSFALYLEKINGIYNTPDTGCLECYRPHASVNTPTPKIDRKYIHCRNM